MFDLTRRQFLLFTGGAAAATLGAAVFRARRNVSIDARLAALMAAGHFSPGLGEMVLAGQGWEAQVDITSLHTEVLGNLPGDAPDLLAQMRQRIQQDFANGDLCAVDGWQLSRTECRLAASPTYSSKPAGASERRWPKGRWKA